MKKVTVESILIPLMYIINSCESLVDVVKDKKLLNYGEIIDFQHEIEYYIGVLRNIGNKFPLFIEEQSKLPNISLIKCLQRIFSSIELIRKPPGYFDPVELLEGDLCDLIKITKKTCAYHEINYEFFKKEVANYE